MEINIGVMCSCMPALRPLFAHIIPRLSIHSLRSKISRSRYHTGNSEQAIDGANFDMGRYRSIEANTSASTQRSPTTESIADEGARNIVAV